MHLRLLLAVLSLVVANLAIPTTSFAATVTLGVQMNVPVASFSVPDSFSVSLNINGSWVTYEPGVGECSEAGITRNYNLVTCSPVELIQGNLYTAADLTSSTVTVTVSGEETSTGDGCDLSSAEALQTWLEYFFLSWGIMIPILFAAYGIGIIGRVIRGTK